MILKQHNNNFVQIPPRKETRLVAERKDAIDWLRRPIVTRFHLSLFAGDRVEFSFCNLPSPLTQPSSSSPSSSCPKRWEAEYSSPSMRISEQKRLCPCTTGERAASVEKMVLTRSSRQRGQSLRISFEQSRCLLFQGKVTDGSLPRNAPLQSPQSTNDSGACTPLTFRWRPNRSSASSFAADNTKTGRVHRMPDSHNFHAHNPFRWNCVQLKQHRQGP